MPENLIFKQNSWWAYKTKEGVRKEKKLQTDHKPTARRRRDQWFKELEATSWGEKPIPTFREAAKMFIEDHMPRLKVRSAQRYDTSLVHLLEHFGNLEVDKIKHSHLSAFENARRAEGVTDPTIRRDLACLSSVYSLCQAMELVDKVNPVSSYKKLRNMQNGLREAAPRDRYLSHEEERALIENASPAYKTMIAFMIDTGLRRTEAMLLRTTNIDFDKEQLKVEGSTSKNSKTRWVPIKKRTMDFLKTLPPDQEYVFMTYQGNPYSTNSPTVWENIQKAARKAGIHDLEIHDLRKTCGCRLLQDDRLEMHEVQKWLGHSSVTVTERSYAFLNVENLHSALNRGGKK